MEKIKAINEIGIKKALLFFIGIIQIGIIKICIFPNMRSFLLKCFGAKIGKNTLIMNVDFINPHRKGFKGLEIGDGCFVGDGTMLDLAENIIIGNNVTIAQRVYINTHTNVGFKDHPLQKKFPSFSTYVKIDSGSFIGACAIILAGSYIGKNSFIATGSLISGEIPNNSLVIGPRKNIMRRIK